MNLVTKGDVNRALIKEFTELLDQRMGLYYPLERWGELEQKLMPLMLSRGFPNMNACLTWLISSLQQNKAIADLAQHLTIGETYFFRDSRLFTVLETQILPHLIQSRQRDRRLRLWSAGCCTGEEAYSLAMILHRLIPDIQNWNIYIAGTDINQYFLNKAAKGRYTQWSFRAAQKDFIQDYFTPLQDGSFSLIPEIKNMVTFAHHNLVEGDYMGQRFNRYDMDLILCNNVLIYFSPTQVEKTVTQLVDSLREGGWLSVAAIEVPFIHSSVLSTKRYPGVVFFEKEDKQTQTVPHQSPTTQLKAKTQMQVQFTQAAKKPQLIKECTQEAILLVRTLANQGDIVQALEWCDTILAVEKLDPLLHHLHAEILLALGRVPEAIKSAKRAIFLNPEFIAAHYLLGVMEEKQGHLPAAKRQFKTTLKLIESYGPDNVLPGTDELTVAHVKDHVTTALGIE